MKLPATAKNSVTSSAVSSTDGLGDSNMPARYAFYRSKRHPKNAFRYSALHKVKRRLVRAAVSRLLCYADYSITTVVPVPWNCTVPLYVVGVGVPPSVMTASTLSAVTCRKLSPWSSVHDGQR